MESGNYVRATASVKDVNDGTFKDDFVFGKPHPLDRENVHKWNINSRYHIVNFNPLFFGNNKTVEFRCHTNTFNKHKIMHWVFITSAIVKYASLNRGKSIGSISLQEILRKVFTLYKFPATDGIVRRQKAGMHFYLLLPLLSSMN